MEEKYSDKKLEVLILSKLYEFNRNQISPGSFKTNNIFDGVDEKQLNFALQYLTTGNFIQSGISNSNGYNVYHPSVITNKGIDLINDLISDQKLNKIIESASSNVDKIALLISKLLSDPSIWELVQTIYENLIKIFLG